MHNVSMLDNMLPLFTVVLATFITLAAIYFAIRYLAYKRSFPLPRLFDVLWVLGGILALVLAASSQEPLAQKFSPRALTWLAFGTLLLFSYTIIFILDQFIVEYFLVKVLKFYVPPPLRKAIVLFIFVVSAVVGVQKIFSINPWAIYAPTSLISLGLGIALKDAFSTFFAGVALSSIIRIGDWIEVEQGQEGEVVSIDWARTVIKTWDGDILFIPNNSLQTATFRSFSYKDRNHRCQLQIGAAYKDPPQKVKKVLLDCTQNISGILESPQPEVLLSSYADSSIVYTLTFWVDNYAQRRRVSSEVASRVWYAFNRKGIEIPFPARTVHMFRKAPEEREASTHSQSILADIDLFKALSEEEQQFLSSRLQKQTYLKGEVVVRQGKAGSSFYMVMKGKLEVMKQTPEGKNIFVHELGTGDFFGELSLLTGEPRSATVRALADSELLRLDKDDFKEILTRDPGLSGSLAGIVAARQAKLSGLQEKARSEVLVKERQDDLSIKIRNFFNLSHDN